MTRPQGPAASTTPPRSTPLRPLQTLPKAPRGSCRHSCSASFLWGTACTRQMQRAQASPSLHQCIWRARTRRTNRSRIPSCYWPSWRTSAARALQGCSPPLRQAVRGGKGTKPSRSRWACLPQAMLLRMSPRQVRAARAESSAPPKHQGFCCSTTPAESRLSAW